MFRTRLPCFLGLRIVKRSWTVREMCNAVADPTRRQLCLLLVVAQRHNLGIISTFGAIPFFVFFSCRCSERRPARTPGSADTGSCIATDGGLYFLALAPSPFHSFGCARVRGNHSEHYTGVVSFKSIILRCTGSILY